MACIAGALATGLVPSAASAQNSSSDGAAGAAALGIFTLFSSFMCLIYVVGFVLAMGSIVLWVLALADLAQRTDSEFPSAMEGQPNANERILWLLVVLLAGAVGALVYYLMIIRKVPRRRSGTPASPPA